MVFSTFFILIQNPKSNTDICSNKQFSWKNDNSFYLVLLNQFLTYFQCITIIQRTIRKKESRYSVSFLQMRKYMQNPGIICVAFRWRLIIRPTRIIFQIVIIPAFQIKRWICHNVVKVQPLM